MVDKHASPAAVREAMASERGYDESLWKLLCEQVGAAALVVPEELGGAGGELADAAVVLEELGKALVPTPLLGTTLAELRAAGRLTSADADTLERLAEGTSIGARGVRPRLRGQRRRRRRRDRHQRQTLTRWTNFTAHPVDTMDPTRRLARVEPHGHRTASAPIPASPTPRRSCWPPSRSAPPRSVWI